jgi:hypothetical protein
VVYEENMSVGKVSREKSSGSSTHICDDSIKKGILSRL